MVLVLLQTTEPIAYGTYKQIPRDYNVRHIPNEKLTFKKNETFKHEFSVTSIRAEKKILGKWEISENNIILNPRMVVEGKGYRINDKKKTNCKAFLEDYDCEQQTFTFKNDTLFIDKQAWFVKE